MKAVISFRPDDELAKEHASRLELLQVNASELARRAYVIGLKQATEEILQEKRTMAQRLLSSLGGGKQRKSFTTPSYQPSGANLIAA